MKIAKLARLELTDSEVSSYQQKLGRVLDYVKELNALETPKDAFVRHVPRDAVAFRADMAVPFKEVKGLIENAPETSGHCFLLPPIMENE